MTKVTISAGLGFDLNKQNNIADKITASMRHAPCTSAVDVRFKGRHVGWQRLDMIVDDRVIVEVKATENNYPIYKTQLLTYLRLTNTKLGLLVNFGCGCVKDGLARVINGNL